MDRSLSSFIYFYSIENKKITTDIFKPEYIEPYVQRRFLDGEKLGFLKCSDNICKPTLKTKITYYLLLPVAKITRTDKEYKKFKNFMDKN